MRESKPNSIPSQEQPADSAEVLATAYNLAMEFVEVNEYKQAVPLLKRVAAAETAPQAQRGAAYYTMGWMYETKRIVASKPMRWSKAREFYQEAAILENTDGIVGFVRVIAAPDTPRPAYAMVSLALRAAQELVNQGNEQVSDYLPELERKQTEAKRREHILDDPEPPRPEPPKAEPVSPEPASAETVPQETPEQLFLQGQDAYSTENYAMAVACYTQAAEQDYAAAQCSLGDCYSKGNGAEKKYGQSLPVVYESGRARLCSRTI